jgi:hypothetical protein
VTKRGGYCVYAAATALVPTHGAFPTPEAAAQWAARFFASDTWVIRRGRMGPIVPTPGAHARSILCHLCNDTGTRSNAQPCDCAAAHPEPHGEAGAPIQSPALEE